MNTEQTTSTEMLPEVLTADDRAAIKAKATDPLVLAYINRLEDLARKARHYWSYSSAQPTEFAHTAEAEFYEALDDTGANGDTF